MTGIEKNVSFGFLVKFPFRNKHETSTRCDCIIPIYVHFRRVTVIFGNLSEAQDRVKRFSLPLQKLASDGLIFLMAQMQLKIFEYIRETGWKSSPETGRNGGMQLNCAVAYQKLRKFPGDLP